VRALRHGETRGLAASVAAVDHVARLDETEGSTRRWREGHLELAYSRHDADELEAYAADFGAYDGPLAGSCGRSCARDGTDAYYGGLSQDGGSIPKRASGRIARSRPARTHERTRAIKIRPQRDGRVVVETTRGAVSPARILYRDERIL
jgi:hypothetical protein